MIYVSVLQKINTSLLYDFLLIYYRYSLSTGVTTAYWIGKTSRMKLAASLAGLVFLLLINDESKEYEEAPIERKATFRGVMFNTNGHRLSQVDDAAFLNSVLKDITIDVFLLQMCQYVQSSTNSADITFCFTDAQLKSTSAKNSGIAWKREKFQIDKSLHTPILQENSLKEQLVGVVLAVKDSKETIMTSEGETYIRDCEDEECLKCLYFSFHGQTSFTNHQQKLEEIMSFFEYAQKNCIKFQLPALIGGDFNYDLRMFSSDVAQVYDNDFKERLHWLENILCFLIPGRSSDCDIDYFCTICSTEFRTKLFVDGVESFDLFKIADDMSLNLCDTSNHGPYTVRISLFQSLIEV